MRGLFSTLRSLDIPNGTVWILAEPSNNNNLRAERQLFGANFADWEQIAQAEMQVRSFGQEVG
jgi:hypothetical protein